VGCLVAEPIKAAHKVIPSSSSEDKHDLPDHKIEPAQANHTLEFGKISFKREVLRRHNHPDKNREESQGPGAIICQQEAVPAVCGFRAIWVVPSRRRKGLGSQLMDAARYVLQAPFPRFACSDACSRFMPWPLRTHHCQT
jgi:N-acetyltransferase